jgi:serum/glucocorticoid-regulated kinase 2
MEIVELDLKLRQAHTNVKLPQLPITPDTIPQPPPKRKSTFLNTLSRLASPTSAKSYRQNSAGQRNNNNNSNHNALTSPTIEANDPFSSFSNGDLEASATATTNTAPSSPSTLSTSIAAYLTTLSNILVLRQDRYWKRFVRVRTDDLESVRVERAIKRVRSDLAAHSRGLSKENALDGHSAEPSESESIYQPEEQSHEERKPYQHQVAAVPDTPAPQEEKVDVGHGDPLKEEDEPPRSTDIPDSTDEMPPPSSGSAVDDARDVPCPSEYTECITNQDEAAPPPTPISTDLPQQPPRMHRSKSADPHKFSRLARTYTSSVASQNGTESQTGDDSSSGQPRRPSARKKRSVSSAAIPKEPKKSQRKVLIDDFEMMRVLGKGCAGKVLLVRHKQTSDLFALKAITKRHVLAHQELQHTLTEQAVLKRMAAESRDPFVVKLWWSFHDKENLFLVMVC